MVADEDEQDPLVEVAPPEAAQEAPEGAVDLDHLRPELLALGPAHVGDLVRADEVHPDKRRHALRRRGAGVRVADVVERLAVQERPVVAGVGSDERDPVPRVDRGAAGDRRVDGDRVVREPLKQRTRFRREVVGGGEDAEDVRVRLADVEPPVEPDVRGNSVVAREEARFERG